MVKMWNTRLSWSGEVPAGLTDLGAVALTRANPDSGGMYDDAVSSSRKWEQITTGSGAAHGTGIYGNSFLLNSVNPATQQERILLENFSGMWPASGKVLVGGWFDNSYTMNFVPLLSTRGGDSPIVYLSSATSQRPRQQVYGASGNLVLDEYETVPWQDSGDWIWYGMVVDLDEQTSQLGSVHYPTSRTFSSEVRTLSGPANTSSTANLDVYGLQNSNYWSSGWADEILIAHPSETFIFEEFLDALAQGARSNGQTSGNLNNFDVTDARIQATTSVTLQTGAERVQWDRKPNVDAPSGSVAYLSDDEGATWTTSTPESLPETFGGLMRWDVPMGSGATFDGIDLIVPQTPPPTLEPIADVVMEQNDYVEVPLVFTVAEGGTWEVLGADTASVDREGDHLAIQAGYAIGSDIITVILTDAEGQSVSRTFTVTVNPQQAVPTPPPVYPKAPIILWNADEPWDILPEPLSGVVTKETNGEETFTFSFWADNPRGDVIDNERRVSCAGENYKVRRITDVHSGGQIIKEVYCEALFYDLATAGQIDARTWTQVTAGEVIREALRGTDWTVGVANVSTLRTYDTEDMNPLELIREVKSNHGGELIFDNENKRVNLLTSAGRDQGVAFFYGFNLKKASRVIDTTSLVTRLYAKNADGETIASINDGKAYLEDYSFTDEIKIAVYDFKEGTSPYTMLNMARATLANRSRPDYSYEVEVSDLSYESGQTIDRFELRDIVRVVDAQVGINETQSIVQMEYDVVQPWNSSLTLSGKLREAGSSESEDAGALTTGTTRSTFDLVPFNLLLNGRFDQGLAHWARFGATIEERDQGTSDHSAVFSGTGEHWIEQTVQVDNRDGFTLSFDMESSGGPTGWTPDLTATATIIYEDGTSEDIELDLG